MELLNLASVGLLIIALGWIIQLVMVLRGNSKISPIFILAYMSGVGMLVISAYMANAPVSYFELGTLVVALAVFVARIVKK